MSSYPRCWETNSLFSKAFESVNIARKEIPHPLESFYYTNKLSGRGGGAHRARPLSRIQRRGFLARCRCLSTSRSVQAWQQRFNCVQKEKCTHIIQNTAKRKPTLLPCRMRWKKFTIRAWVDSSHHASSRQSPKGWRGTSCQKKGS